MTVKLEYMKYKILILLSVIIIIMVCYYLNSTLLQTTQDFVIGVNNISYMKLTSPEFNNGDAIPKKYTCDGIDVNPPLDISFVPKDTKSLVLIVDDPDAPSGVWDHWIKFNIKPTTSFIAEGDENFGVSGKGTSGKLSYMGPCPPDKEHRYNFTLYAVDIELPFKQGAAKNELLNSMKDHILAETTLLGRYSRLR